MYSKIITKKVTSKSSKKFGSPNRQELKPVVEVPGPGHNRAKTMVG
jgi:hypothetical protein